MCFIIALITTFLSCCAAESEPEGEILYRSYQSGLYLKAFTGSQARKYVPAIIGLRVELLRCFPYLNDVNREDEIRYMEKCCASPTAKFLLLFDKQEVVGFSRSALVSEELPEIQEYRSDFNGALLIEMLLDSNYCKKNIERMFAYYRACALQLGGKYLVCMSVNRPEDNRSTLGDYQSFESILQHNGFKNMNQSMDFKVHWKRIDTGKNEDNILSVWTKPVDSSSAFE